MVFVAEPITDMHTHAGEFSTHVQQRGEMVNHFVPKEIQFEGRPQPRCWPTGRVQLSHDRPRRRCRVRCGLLGTVGLLCLLLLRVVRIHAIILLRRVLEVVQSALRYDCIRQRNSRVVVGLHINARNAA